MKKLFFPLKFIPSQKINQTFNIPLIALIFCSTHLIISTDIISLSVFANDSYIQEKLGNPNSWEFGIINASLFIGSLFGELIFHYWNLKMCRVEVFQLALLFWMFISIVQLTSPFNYIQAFITRFLKGFSLSAIKAVTYVYMVETFPRTVTFRLCNIFEHIQAFGLFITYAASTYIINHSHKERDFRLFSGIPLLCAGVIYVLSIYIPQTPFWLVSTGHYDKGEYIQNKFAHIYNNPEEFPSRNKVDLVDFFLNDINSDLKDSFTLKKIKLLLSSTMRVSCGVFIIQFYSMSFNIMIDQDDKSLGYIILFTTTAGFVISNTWFYDSSPKNKHRFTIFSALVILFFIINIINCILSRLAFEGDTVKGNCLSGLLSLLLVECVCYPHIISSFPVVAKLEFLYENRKSRVPIICNQVETVLISLFLICTPSLLTDLKLTWIFFLILCCFTFVLLVISTILYPIYRKLLNENSHDIESSNVTEPNKYYGSEPIILTEMM